MKVVQFEGTPEEFKTVAHLFGDSPSSEKVGLPEKSGSGLRDVEPQEAIRRMLTRHPISQGQMAVYKALADGKLEYREFLRRADRTAGQMAGVLGALGRRINNTKQIHQAGLPGNTKAILKWESLGGEDYVSLTPDALEALKAEDIV